MVYNTHTVKTQTSTFYEPTTITQTKINPINCIDNNRARRKWYTFTFKAILLRREQNSALLPFSLHRLLHD